MKIRILPKRNLFIAGILLILSCLLGAQEKKTLSFVDTINLKRVSGPSLSPDGSQLLFAVSAADWKKNKTVSHIWRISVDGSGLVQMTNGADGESGGAWSPDGHFIAFISKRGEETTDPQIFLLNTTGGEALQLTDHKGGVDSFFWSPDAKKIYFLSSDPLSKEEEKKKKDKDDAFLFEKDYKNRHLWVIGVESKEEKRLTGGDFSVLNLSLSRDGTKIVYNAAPTPLYDDSDQAEIWVMDLASAKAHKLTDNRIGEQGAELSPDDSQVLFIADANEKFESYYQSTLYLVPAEGGSPKLLLPDFSPEIQSATWSADGRTIIFSANMGVHSEIFRLDLASFEIQPLTDGRHAVYGLDYVPGIDTIAYLESTPDNPGTFWVTGMKGFAPRLVYDPNPELKDYRLAEYEVIHWKSTDGRTVEGILIYPTDYQKGKRYPLLVETHGGPMSSDMLTFDGYAQARAGRGYAIFCPNYRGSTGYGNAVLRDMVGHYFLHSDDDVLTGVDYLVKRGIADPEKLGAMGWSAGGHMTNWLITQTGRFKAASSGAGASNWISMYAQSDVRIYRTPWFGSDPWHADSNLKAYRDHSPIFQVFRTKTPTLLMFGQNDNRVPLPQGIEMYHGLKANGVPVELVIFPREGHGPRELRHVLFKMNKEFQWFEKYIMGRDFQFEEPPSVEKKEEK
jgi:dipeptidyl aminopeptidase/acylaminoacyl peptidase